MVTQFKFEKARSAASLSKVTLDHFSQAHSNNIIIITYLDLYFFFHFELLSKYTLKNSFARTFYENLSFRSSFSKIVSHPLPPFYATAKIVSYWKGREGKIAKSYKCLK